MAQIDSTIYPTRRTFTWTDSAGVEQHISISDSIKTLRENGILPYNQVWDNSNAYVGFDTSVKQYARIFGGTTSAWYDVTDEGSEGYNIVTNAAYPVINIRPVLIAMRRRTADNTGSTITNRVTVTERYTGIDDPDAAVEQMIFATGGDENWFPVTSWNPNSILFHATAQVYKRKRSDYARLGELPVTGLDWLDNLDWIINGYTDTDFISQFVISPYLDTGTNGVISRTAMRSVQSFNTYTGANDFYNFTMSFVAEFYNPVTGAVYYKRLPAGGTGNNPDAPTDEYAPFVYANPSSNPNDIRWNTWGAPAASFGGLWLNENINQPLADGSVTARKIPLSIMADGIPTDDLTTWDASVRTNPIISVGLSDNMQIKIREIPNATNEIITAPYQNAPCSIGNGMAIWTCSNPYSTEQLFLIREVYSVAEIEQALSALGIWWTGNPDSINSAIGANCTDPDVHLGVIRSDGTTTGDYISGTQAAESPQAQWTDAMQDNVYIPVSPIVDYNPETMGDSMNRPGTISVGGTNKFITQYVLNSFQVAALGEALWSGLADATFWKNVIWATLAETMSFDISSLLNYFVDLKVYPFDLSALPTYSAKSDSKLYIGRGVIPLDVSASTYAIGTINQYCEYLDGGSVTVPKHFGDFRDYTNTIVTVFIPFIGDIQLNAADVMGNTLHLQYAVDFSCGGCTAYLDCETRDGITYTLAIKEGSIGASVPMSASNVGRITAQVINNAKDYFALVSNNSIRGGQALIGANTNNAANEMMLAKKDTVNMQQANALADMGAANDIAAVGAIAGAAIQNVNEVANYVTSIISQPPIEASLKSRGQGFASFGQPTRAYLQIRRCITDNPDGYSQAFGHPVMENVPLGNMTGFVKCANVRVEGIPATESERTEIVRLLQDGVYIE